MCKHHVSFRSIVGFVTHVPSLKFSHIQTVIGDLHVSGLTGNQWDLALKFLYNDISLQTDGLAGTLL